MPITSRKPNRTVYPNEVALSPQISGLSKESLVLCYQIRVLDKRRLGKHISKIDDVDIQNKIIEALCFQLGIKLYENTYSRTVF